jgi:hypothetical protein
MSERVKIHGCLGLHSEFFGKISPSDKDLTDKGLSARHVAVRLKIPTAQYMPLPLFHELLDSGKKLGLIHLNPLIQDCFIVVEYKLFILFAKLSGCPESGESFTSPLFPLPKPNWVEMSVTDEI